MVTLVSRGDIVSPTETIQLTALFRDMRTGLPVDLDSFPTITIQQPSGNIALGPTSSGVYRISTGEYGYDYETTQGSSLGVWTDIWRGSYDGYTAVSEFNFIVLNTQTPMVNTDGYIHLGDNPGFNYSQTATNNINLLLKTLKARLDSSGKIKTTDDYGNDIYVDCDIFTIDQLVSFLANSLTLFNEIPHFTLYTFEDTEIIAQFHDVIVQGATIMALWSKALLERGREFQITDQGLQFQPPTVSELMSTEANAELTNHFEKVKMIKASMKPAPLGLGTLTISTTRHPAVARLRHLRARQIY